MTTSTLIAPGSPVVFIPAGSIEAVRGTVIEIDDDWIGALLDRVGNAAMARACEGGLVVISSDGRSTVVAAKATPSGSLTRLVPHHADPPERRAHPRVPASNLVQVKVMGRMGASFVGHLLDLSLGGCQFVRHRNNGAVISKKSTITLDTTLDGVSVRFGGEVVQANSVGADDVFSVRFTSVDAATWGTLESFVERRLERVTALNATIRPVPAVLEVRGQRYTAHFDPLDNSFDIEAPGSARVRARFRLPGITPVITAAGMIIKSEGGRSVARWHHTDPVTRVIIERAGLSRRMNLHLEGEAPPRTPISA
ncbi:MAG: PilZ domain-containing protein [Actinomycetota bacterium]